MISIRTLISRAKASWQSMPTQKKSTIFRNGFYLGGVVVLSGLYLFNKQGSTPKAESVEVVSKRTVATENYVDRDIDARIEKAVLDALEEKERFDREMGNLGKRHREEPFQADESLEDLDDLEFEDHSTQQNFTPVPPQSYPMSPESIGEMESQPAQFVGGIKWEGASIENKQTTNGQQTSGFIIPVGFMPAMMIVGVQASVANAGKGNPKPIHLRVQAPATLPNKLKLNLAGCFVIANTWGNLASERIEGETVSLTCMTQDKKTIISGSLSGYLADQDGQRDIAGRVVTRAGALLGRRFIADTLSGGGQAIASNTGQVAISPLGSVTSISGSELAERGLASGVSKGFQGAGEYISELLAQSGPIIESGAARPVMIMVQKESVLTIKSIETYQNENVGGNQG